MKYCYYEIIVTITQTFLRHHGTCNHVMAVFFKVEAIVRIGPQSPTSLHCTWSMPKGKFHVQPVPVSDISVNPQRYSKHSKYITK